MVFPPIFTWIHFICGFNTRYQKILQKQQFPYNSFIFYIPKELERGKYSFDENELTLDLSPFED